MAAHARAKPRPVLLTGAGALRRAWRGWRRSRPFSGALVTIAGGTEIAAGRLVGARARPAGHRADRHADRGRHPGLRPAAAVRPGPALGVRHGAILLAASALTTSHLGGYLVGTVLAASGGAVAFAWVPRVPAGRRVRAPIPGFTLIRGEGGLHPGPGGPHPGPGGRPSLAATRPDLAVTRPGPPGRDQRFAARTALVSADHRSARASPCAGRSGPPRPGCARRASAWRPTGDCARCPATGAAARRSR